VASYYNKIDKQEKALEVYEKILSIDINDAAANRAMTVAKKGGGNDNTYLRSLTPIIEDSSIPVDRKVLELVPYIEQLSSGGDTELADALTMLSDKIAMIHPEEAKAHALKGDILRSTGNIKGAAKSYEKTVSLNDNVYTVWEGLLEAYTELGNLEKMKKAATSYLDLFPNKPAAYVYYGRAYSLANDPTEAIDLLSEGLMVSGKDINAKSNVTAELARAYMISKDDKQALSYVDQSLSMSNNQNPLALEIKGDILYATGKEDEAISLWRDAIKAGMNSSRLQSKIDNKKLK